MPPRHGALRLPATGLPAPYSPLARCHIARTRAAARASGGRSCGGNHTGLVVVGEMGGGGRQEHLALGDTPHMAVRLQGLATPDTVVISEAAHRLVQGYFTMAALDPQTLKGVVAPVPVYCILGTSAAQSRLEVAASTGLTPLVGRESEVVRLLKR